MQVDFPYGIDTRGRTAGAGEEDHVRDLIEAVLFTSPGERVNRPTFGSGVLQLVFAPNSDAVAATTQFLVQGSLQQWLADVISVTEVEVDSFDSTLSIRVSYTLLRSGQTKSETFRR